MLVIAPISDMVAHVAGAGMKTLTEFEGESSEGFDTVEPLPFISPDSVQVLADISVRIRYTGI